jgi:shikimate dehydrogenase
VSAGFVRVGVLGDPLAFTLSPVLHRAALEACGVPGDSEALRTPAAALGGRFAELAARGWRGVNLTHPLKAVALAHLASVSDGARRARSVNTVTFEAGGPAGESTDGPGFVDLLRALGRDPGVERAVLLGAGGASRSIALALLEAGAPAVTMTTRDVTRATTTTQEIPGLRVVERGGDGERRALAESSLVVDALPGDDAAGFDAAPHAALAVELAYGAELPPRVARARAAGRAAFDGLGLLVFQGRRSLARWLGREIPLEPMARAVGWPR